MGINIEINLKHLLGDSSSPPKPEKAKVVFDEYEPTCFEEFIGQENAKTQLKLEIQSAIRDNRPLRHIFLYGPPGTGKTTLVKLIAKEFPMCGGYLYETTGAQFASAEDVVNGFNEYQGWPLGTIWLIDEVSEMAKTASTVFHAPMTQKSLLWKGMRRRNEHTEQLMLCATTNYVAKSPGAFRDRFDLQIKMGYYETKELVQVAEQVVKRLEVELPYDVAYFLASHAAGTPRKLNRLIRTAVAITGRGGKIGIGTAERVTKLLRIFPLGLEEVQVQYLRALSNSPKKRMGKNALAATLNEDSRTLEEVWEPYLLYEGLVVITGGGRMITETGERYLIQLEKGRSFTHV